MHTKVENIVNINICCLELPDMSFGCNTVPVLCFCSCTDILSLPVAGYVQHLKKPGDNNTEVICFHSVEPPYLSSGKTSHSVT